MHIVMFTEIPDSYIDEKFHKKRDNDGGKSKR